MNTSLHTSSISTLIITALLLSGCATTVDLSKFHDADLKEATILPSKDQLTQQRAKIVVLDADESYATEIDNTHLGDVFSSTIEKEISTANAEVVDRNIANKLKDELKLAENGGAGSYSGPSIAEFAIRSKVTSAQYGVSYIEASSWKDSEGKIHVNPAHYNHSAQVAGNISLYELPSLRLVTTINVQGNASTTEPRKVNNQIIGASLLRTSAASAISKQAHQLKNLFAPKGYVVERRTDGDISIFRVMMGQNQGVKPEDKVIIYSLRKKPNALTGIEQLDEIPVSQAVTSDQVNNTDSWIVPDDKKTSEKIRLGDFVKVKY
jgi:hypothetical protein